MLFPFTFLIAVAAVGLPPETGGGTTPRALERALSGVELVEKHGAAVSSAIRLIDETGAERSLGDLLVGDLPVALSFNYVTCATLCSLQLAGIAKAAKDLGSKRVGLRFLTISIDPADTPEKLAKMKETYVRQTGAPETMSERWSFAVGSADDVKAIAESVGFRYRRDPVTGELMHKATLIILTPDGRVSQYLHGVRYDVTALATAMERAGEGDILGAEEQAGIVGFLLDCFSGRIGVSTVGRTVMRIGGGVTLALFAAFLGWLLLVRPRARNDAPPAHHSTPPNSRP